MFPKRVSIAAVVASVVITAIAVGYSVVAGGSFNAIRPNGTFLC